MISSGGKLLELILSMNDSILSSAAPDLMKNLCNLTCGAKSLKVNPCFLI
jgi:hypothetical protein